MKRGVLVLLSLMLLAVLAAPAIANARGAERVYPVAQVAAGLSNNPSAWIGKTVLVRGRLIMVMASRSERWGELVPETSQPLVLLLAPGPPPPPLLALLRSLPLVRTMIPQPQAPRVGRIGVYRVRLLTQLLCSPVPCANAQITDAAPGQW